MKTRHIELIAGFADGSLSKLERRELLAVVRKDAAVAEELAREVDMHRRLQFTLQENEQKSDKEAQEMVHYLRASRENKTFMSELARRRSKEVLVNRVSWGVGLALAASLLLMLTVWKSDPVNLDGGSRYGKKLIGASITNSSAESKIYRSGKWIPALVGTALYEGDIVKSGARHGVKIKYRDESTRVSTRKKTCVEFLKSENGKRLALEYGRMDASVAKQIVGKSMVIVTEHAEAEVVGTKLRLTVSGHGESPPSTRLDVFEGLVRLKNLSNQKSIDVGQGQYGMVKDGVDFVALDIPKEVMEEFLHLSGGRIVERAKVDLYGKILFEDNFEDGLGNWDVVSFEEGDSYQVVTSDSSKYAEVFDEYNEFSNVLEISPGRPTRKNVFGKRVGICSKIPMEAKRFVVEAKITFSKNGTGGMSNAGVDSLMSGAFDHKTFQRSSAGGWALYRWEYTPVPESGDGVYLCRYIYRDRLLNSYKVRLKNKKILISFFTKDRKKGYIDQVTVREVQEGEL